ncbi:hypothetical protein K445DRAFT_9597 [Daldinia sp. EC12]|nr:hypothetical protein K445DRAFT_9597 [Daldinia sp. EC12]
MTILDSYMLTCEKLSREESRIVCSPANARAATCLIRLVDISLRPLELQPQNAHGIKYQRINSTIRKSSDSLVHHLPIRSNKLGGIDSPPTPRLSPSPTPSLAFSLSDGESGTTDEEDDITTQIQDRHQSYYNHYKALIYKPPVEPSQWSNSHTRMGFHEAGNNNPENVGSAGEGVSIARGSANIKSHTHPNRRRKTSDRNPDSDEESIPTPKRASSSRTNPRRKFACPFYKHNIARYLRCSDYELFRIGDVRQHVIRRHMQAIHCPRCFMTFDRQPELEYHFRQSSPCPIKNSQDLEGVTADQVELLRRASKFLRSISDEEKWYRIWDILFPDILRPASPYYEDGMQVPLGLIREFMKTSLPRTFNERFTSRILIPECSQSEMTSELRGIVQGCFDQFGDTLRVSLTESPGERIEHDINRSVTPGALALHNPSGNDEYRRRKASHQPPTTPNLHPDETILNSVHDTLAEQPSYVEIHQIDTVPQTALNNGCDSIRETLRPTLNAKQPALIGLPDHEHQRSGNQPRASASTQGRKPPSYEMWDRYKSKIHQLYIDENRTLQELMLTMEESYGFYAS